MPAEYFSALFFPPISGPFAFSFAAAAAKWLQSCPTLCDPIDSSHQAPPSLGFSRQEHWSGLPFPLLARGKSLISLDISTLSIK